MTKKQIIATSMLSWVILIEVLWQRIPPLEAALSGEAGC
jgi:hypothetical protein